ncbi:hypothetical protein A464_53 [Salmonella bongori N268-08]|uniref:Uncharacterized protein n=1 Tax=Salmonella bongori N268-08 TaxID=1197719 RepID=S5MRK3_SALBN|nr:hypothetical protein A464_53 [Salmonella bongori N268-08]
MIRPGIASGKIFEGVILYMIDYNGFFCISLADGVIFLLAVFLCLSISYC